MARRKIARPLNKPFKGPLAQPIRRAKQKLSLLADPPKTITLDLSTPLEWMEKLELLANHYDVKMEGPAGWGFLLALRLAIQFVPGFSVVYGDEGRRGRPKTRDPNQILAVAGLIKKSGLARTDLEACRVFATCLEPDLERPHRRSALEKRAKVLANLVSKARGQRRKADL